MCDESCPHGVGLTKSSIRRIVKNSSNVTISTGVTSVIGCNGVADNNSDSIVLTDSEGNPQVTPRNKSKEIATLITVTSDSNAVEYEYDPATDSFKVIDSVTDLQVGEVIFTKVDGDFDFSDGAVIDPQVSMAVGAMGHIKAVLKNTNDVEVGSVTITVQRNS